jgi:hypothetical protein
LMIFCANAADFSLNWSVKEVRVAF